ncbi:MULTISPECIES: methyltransferase [Rhodomicrobium]|uniref:methyltransferase family protein n=1 Tax=Rhodomicrobium TaxID=1068 RepID=UPI0014838A7D|nr:MULTISPECIES: methyltransferase [Rhodomicrobium]
MRVVFLHNRVPRSPARGSIARIAGLAYGVAAFVATFAFFTHYVLFLGNLPKLSAPWLATTVDTGPTLPPFAAALVDLALVALFGLQHSLMARPGFKAWWTRTVPKGLERSTYVMAASAVGFIMMLFWQPIPIVLWEAPLPAATALWVAFGLGWLLLLASGISFNIFELLGLRQAWAWSQNRPAPELSLKTNWLYDSMRHPMYVGFLLGVWMTPHMTVGHALMAAGFTLYILVAMRYEERDLSRNFGPAYESWRQGRAQQPAGRPRP